MNEVHEGGCLCRSVRFRSTGKPRMTTACHCGMCQRATGSAFSTEVIFRKAAVEFQGDGLNTYTYRSPEHGRALYFEFCPTCGTKLGLTLERFPNLQIIYAGTYDDPAWVKPESHIFMRYAVAWIQPLEGINCFLDHMIAEDGTLNKPAGGTG